MKIKYFLISLVFSLVSSVSWAGCSYTNVNEIRSLSNSYEAWKSVTEAMSECGNF